MKQYLLSATALRSALCVGLAVAAAPTFAQTTAADRDPSATLQSEAEIESGQNASADTAGETIVVTGSRIRRPNLEAAVPVTSIGGQEFFQTGQVSVGDVLNELPAIRSTFTQSNSTRFLGTAGLSLLDLRGLGTQRTLTLVNGRRHVGSNILGNAVEVDVNTIPTDLIERVDVVTGGNSAIYGSDAIAGVVNFVLKRDYEGFQIRGQSGISKYGDYGSQYVSALAGQNFADGRGNIAINAEYAHQSPAYASGRPNLRVNSRFNQIDSDPAGTPNGSDGNPDFKFYTDTRFPFYNNGGDFITCCELGSTGGQNFVTYLFTPAGDLVRQTGTLIGNNPNNTRIIGGNGSTGREGQQLALIPNQDRYSVNLLAHYEISPALEPFVEAKFVRSDVRGSQSGPFFTATGSPREVFFTQNPFLSTQARQFLSDYYGVGVTDDQPFYITRTVTDFGNRNESFRRDTYRIVGGVRGDFNDDWSYELSANYGQLKEKNRIFGNVNQQRYLLAIDAVRNPANGQIVCRAQIDPTARVPFEFAADEAFAAARLAEDVANCVPVNLFGEGNVSQAAKNYILQDTVASGKTTQFVLNGFVTGDTSAFFNLPGGPLGFALGAEYRRETVSYNQDPLVEAGLTFYNAIPTFDPPSLKVKEAFAEIRLPILSERPFFHELTVEGAGRVADYNGKTGTVFAYDGRVRWAPVQDVLFRASYSRSVRAPNLADLYTPLGQNFELPFQDPCSASNVGSGTASRITNCAAAGIPTSYDYIYTESLLYQSGGNTNLKEETSTSWTVGTVLQPRFIPGLSLTVDYFDIKVDDVITSPTAQQLVNACYDLPSLQNQFCSLFQRAGAGGGPRGEIQNQILEGSLQAVLLNYAKLKSRGVDVEASYRTDLGSIGQLGARVIYTHALQNDEFLDPTQPGFANQLLKELNEPQDTFNVNLDLKRDKLTLGYQMRYISRMITSEYEDYFSKQGRPPQNADRNDIRWTPDVFYHDVRVGYDVTDGFNFYLGVDNVANRKPPLGFTGVGEGSGVYSNVGRFFYAGAVAKF